VTVLPLFALLPAAGLWESTVPSCFWSVTFLVFVATLKPAAFSAL